MRGFGLLNVKKCRLRTNMEIGYITHRNPINGLVWVEFEKDCFKGWWFDPRLLKIL